MNRAIGKAIGAMVAVAMLALTGCSALSQAQQEPDLSFEVAIQINAAQEVHASLGVSNEGEAAFKGDEEFNGQMDVRRKPSGELRASAHVIPLREVAPGETVWPLSWHGQLEPGDYELTWGAEGYGSSYRAFSVIEQDGRLYFEGNEPAVATPVPTEPAVATPAVTEPGDEESVPTTVESPDRWVEEAVADLAARLDIEKDGINVLSVEGAKFGDTSLGVPEPDQSYAEVIVPGFVIRLEAQGQVYEYHAGDERVVLASQEGDSAPEPTEAAAPQQAYRKVVVSELGLTFEVPESWVDVAPEFSWAPQQGSETCLAFTWAKLTPSMEPEAALLPDQAQIVDSAPVELSWARARRFDLEVYGPAPQGGDQKAPVAFVESHILIVSSKAGERVGLDFFTRTPNGESSEAAQAALEHMVASALMADDALGEVPSSEEGQTGDW